MVNYNKEKYLKYKLRQQLLNRKQISLTLDKDIANALQENLKRYNRVIFEHQLKSYFLQEPFVDISQINNFDPTNQPIQHINLLIAELKKELQDMNNTMNILYNKLEILLSRRNYSSDNIEVLNPNIPQITSKKVNISQGNKIPYEVLDLSISLYKHLNSWKQVCNELARQGYLSRNNTTYSASSLSRAVSQYKSTLNQELSK